ncbi:MULTISPECIES: hypothetical protein [Bradyrhizobium]|uniref:Uncharacterized protein n=1 Tax=Bradyrhizobium frederickii TaxID=2560054 RepID=A0A4Y9KTG9_9BRAD|nr:MULTISPECIES: hypothetical protein [Bradyrhizobium]TFV28608.1 hypothetical protein E4K66_38895 [Bradyrhizobium frederickii]TFV68397.1 hypothetical protein E4K64_37040 [Bradyrhizobium frederickii]
MDNLRPLVVRDDVVSRSVQFKTSSSLREALGPSVLHLRTAAGAHEGEDGEWRRVAEEERDRGAASCRPQDALRSNDGDSFSLD